MSYITWHNYGYGICTDQIKERRVERLLHLLNEAPVLQEQISAWLEDCGIEDPSWEDYMEYDQDYSLGIATILKEVIEEAEGISLTACDNFDSEAFLLYQPNYPWNLSEKERYLTEEELHQMFCRYISILTTESIDIGYQEVENGG